MIYEVVVPDLGATGADMTLTAWFVQPNEFVRAGSALFAVTTDKADMEVEAFRDGYLRDILVRADSPVASGTVVAVLADSLEEQVPMRLESGLTQSSLPRRLQEEAGGNEPPAGVAEEDHPPSRWQDVPTRQRGIAREKTAALDPSPVLPERNAFLEMFRRMVLIRRFEDHLYRLFLQGLVPGTLHQYQGQEAVAAGVCFALEPDDVIFSTHRPVGHFIAKGSSLRRIAAELWGKAEGCAGGKGGQMHLVDASVGAFPSNAIVGANIPIAVGAALGFKLSGHDRIAVSFFGDGAANIGAFHEGLNLAAVKDAPVIFVCENNLYAASTHISLSMRVSHVAERAASYGIPGLSVDGMDVAAVYDSAYRAVARARSGGGPTLLEYKTFRYAGHSRGDPGGYRTKEELQHWRERDPIRKGREILIQQFQVEETEIEHLERKCEEEVRDAVEFARSSSDPEPETCTEHVYASREVLR